MRYLIKAFTVLILIGSAELRAQEPSFRLKDLDNQWMEYKDLKGTKLTVIDFWATWCQPCIKSLPHMDAMSREFADRGVAFIGVSVDGPRNQNKVRPFIQSRDISYPILRDINSELMNELSVSAVPTLIIYDARGEQVYFHEGFRPGDEELIRAHILEHLDQ